MSNACRTIILGQKHLLNLIIQGDYSKCVKRVYKYNAIDQDNNSNC